MLISAMLKWSGDSENCRGIMLIATTVFLKLLSVIFDWKNVLKDDFIQFKYKTNVVSLD